MGGVLLSEEVIKDSAEDRLETGGNDVEGDSVIDAEPSKVSI